MNRHVLPALAGTVALWWWCVAPSQARDESAANEIPAAYAPFEHMIGAWKGNGIPRANRVKGWPESHIWAWKFSKGVPAGMGLELKGDKILAQGQLRYDDVKKTYRLDGTGPDGKPVAFIGTMDKPGKSLVLDRETAEGKERLTIRPNSNHIRYQMLFDRQETGAPQYKNVIEVGLTKAGESFAAGASAADLPKCIVTGGAATLNVTYEGKTYALCCTGCRDEFNDNPAKYVKKALLRAQARDKIPAPSAAARGKGDGEFDGLVDEPKAEKTKPKAKPSAGDDSPRDDAAKASTEKKPPADPATKADALLNQARALEKAGKTAPALVFYRRIANDFPDLPQAKTAKDRVKALGGK